MKRGLDKDPGSQPFSLKEYEKETNGFRAASGPQRVGIELSRLGYMAFLAYFRLPWRTLFRSRLSDDSNPLFRVAPAISEEHIKHCRVFANRYDMISSFEPGKKWAEIGTFEGKFAREILDRCSPAELHVIDRSLALARSKDYIRENGSVRFHEGNSATVLSFFPDGFFDYIYLDAGHDLFNMAQDAMQAKKKLKPDGTLIFDGYMIVSHVTLAVYGIVPVVHSLCRDDGWEMTALALNYKAYFNVALRRRI